MGPSSYSLLLGLVLPTVACAQLCYEFPRIRDAWPNLAVEIKGGRLNAEQGKQVADLLAAFDGLIEFRIIDMGHHDTPSLERFKGLQAGSVTESVTPLHQPTHRHVPRAALQVSLSLLPTGHSRAIIGVTDYGLRSNRQSARPLRRRYAGCEQSSAIPSSSIAFAARKRSAERWIAPV
jgi:hypothetical protein